MTPRPTALAISTLALLFGVSFAPRAQAVPEALLVVAGPLAEHYGVPADAVTGMLQNGMSLESVTQLLIVKQSSGQTLDDVTSVYHAQGDDIDKTAAELDVAAKKYSASNVQAAIDKAKADAASSASTRASDAASTASGKAASAASDATSKAAESTNKAVDSLLGGMPKE
jgi:uncharacterized membrane protein